MSDRSGQRLGAYTLVMPLGHGGMGEVWRAEHAGLGRPAAVKLVRTELIDKSADPQKLLERFRREARATAGLSSPHTVTVHDFGVTADGCLWYAMELLDGLDLESLVEAHGPVPPARAVQLLSQACDALAEAHAKGLIHRDIKPANLLACRQGLAVDYLKVLDFGLSRPILTPEEGRLTADFAITGTPAWISPEAAMGETQLDHRADIYGLGCVAYWLLCGKPVFEAEQPMRLVMAHVGAEVVPPSVRLGRELPEDLQALVLRCLAKRPADRPQSALDLKAQLHACDVGEWGEATARQWWQQHGQTRAQTVDQLRASTAAVDAPTDDALDFTGQLPAAALAPLPPLANPTIPRVAPAQLSVARAGTVAKLRDGFAASLLDMPEFERRVGLAEAAQDLGQLQTLTADLPAPAAAPAPLAALAPPPSRYLARRATRPLVAILSGIERKGRWQPERLNKVVTVLGGGEIDLCQAQLGPGCTEFRVVAILGGVEFTVPADLPVVIEGVGILGAFHSSGGVGPSDDPQAPWVRITGVAILGGVEVKIAPVLRLGVDSAGR